MLADLFESARRKLHHAMVYVFSGHGPDWDMYDPLCRSEYREALDALRDSDIDPRFYEWDDLGDPGA